MNKRNEQKAKYDKAHTVRLGLKLNVRTDYDILCKLAELNNKQGYIKSLIRKDLLDHPALINGGLHMDDTEESDS